MTEPRLVLGDLDLSSVDAQGVRWITTDVDGWDDSPGSTLSLTQKARASGGWAGSAYDTPRHIVAKGYLFAPSSAVRGAAMDRIKSTCSLEDTVLTVIDDDDTRWVTVRRSDQTIVRRSGELEAEWSIQVASADHRKFGATLTDSTALPSTSGGLTIPYTIPYSINSTQVSGQVSLTNPGNTPGPVRLRIDGPITGPVVTHVSSGLRLVFAASLALGVGEFLTVDMESQLVLAQGQSGRANWVTSRGWSQFEPGVNTWAFTAVGYSAGALLTVSADPSWQ